MIKTLNKSFTRRSFFGALAAGIVAAPTYSHAAGFLRGAGDVRKLKMFSGQTGERINTIYWIDGEYVSEALREINHFMRDWRTGTTISIDTRTVDIMAAAHRLLDTSEPYQLLSGYRSPKTNAMLRRNTRGVAKKSLHMVGKAADLRLKSRSPSQMSRAAQSCKGGGVGRYSGSNFVHMDCGPLRTWRG